MKIGYFRKGEGPVHTRLGGGAGPCRSQSFGGGRVGPECVYDVVHSGDEGYRADDEV